MLDLLIFEVLFFIHAPTQHTPPAPLYVQRGINTLLIISINTVLVHSNFYCPNFVTYFLHCLDPKNVSILNCHLVHLVYFGPFGLFLSNSIYFSPLWSNSIHLVNLVHFDPFDLFWSILVYFSSINSVHLVYFSSLRSIQFILVYLVHFWSISIHCYWIMLSFNLLETKYNWQDLMSQGITNLRGRNLRSSICKIPWAIVLCLVSQKCHCTYIMGHWFNLKIRF